MKETLSVYEKKNAALLSDLRFMRDENQKLHDKVRDANEAVMLLEQQIAQASQESAEIQMAKDALKHKLNDQGGENRQKDLKIAEC